MPRRMRIADVISSPDEPAFSFELFPPKTDAGERTLLHSLDALRDLGPAFVSVTYGAGGSTRDRTLDLVARIGARYGLEAMAHLTCVGSTEAQLRATLDELAALGVDNVLALRGDPPAGEPWTKVDGGLEHADELVALIAGDYELGVGAACFPETHLESPSLEHDLRHLRTKVDAGAEFLITQLFFDNAAYFRFVAAARAAGIEVPIVPGVLPITDLAGLERITTLCGATVPAPLRRELDRRAGDPAAIEELGVAYATLQCSELLAGGAPGLHFYTLNRAEPTRSILSALQLTRPWASVPRPLAGAAAASA
jgi:methylenetetrahydrofolate reductase (NADPH)